MTNISFPKKLKPLISNPMRYNIIYGGRGSGKSWSIARILLIKSLESKIRILCARQLQNSISESVKKLLEDQIILLGLSNLFTITKDKIVCHNGSTFLFKGILSNVQEIKSLENIKIVWLEESNNLSKEAFKVITPTIRAENSYLIFSFNPFLKSDFIYDKFITNTPPENSLIIKLNYYDNKFFPKVLESEMEYEKVYDFENYSHVWLGELISSVDGSIFGKHIKTLKKDGRLLPINVVDDIPVNTYWDVGANDLNAIWFIQEVAGEFRIIDYYENRLEDLNHYVDFIDDQPYEYGIHYLPHDCDHSRLGSDGNKTIEEQLLELGLEETEIVPRIPLKKQGIEMARTIFNKCYFHKDDDARGSRVALGFEHLSAYKYKLKNNSGVYNLSPNHDISSNGADAFMQFAQSQNYNNQAPSIYV